MASQHYTEWSILDYSNEKSPVKLFNGAIDITSLAGFLTDVGSLRGQLTAIILGTVNSEKWVGDSTVLSNTLPTDPDAQRERKGLVTYTGNTTGKKFTFTIPTIRTKTSGGASLIVPGTDLFNLTLSPIAAFVAGVNGFARTPDDDTEAITIQSIRLVGRNI
jgi:hypothetical protein